MFTGLIEAICVVKKTDRATGSMRLAIDLGSSADGTKLGDSIAVNGVCLTVSRFDGTIAAFDLSSETLKKSNLGKLKIGSAVNVERAVRPTDRLGGHFVQGHIDGVAIIKQVDRRDDYADITFTADAELLEQMVVKGSVAVDGISLTIAAMNENSFSVTLIPQTLKSTTLGKAKPGDTVNIETDIIAKIIKKQLTKILPQEKSLTVEKLKELGF